MVVAVGARLPGPGSVRFFFLFLGQWLEANRMTSPGLQAFLAQEWHVAIPHGAGLRSYSAGTYRGEEGLCCEQVA